MLLAAMSRKLHFTEKKNVRSADKLDLSSYVESKKKKRSLYKKEFSLMKELHSCFQVR